MKIKTEEKFKEYLKQLYEFKKQDENLDLIEFEKWKSNLLVELKANYKNRFSKLQFYTISEETDFYGDDLPF